MSKKIFLLGLALTGLLLSCTHIEKEREPATVDRSPSNEVLSPEDNRIYKKLLNDSLAVFNRHLRHGDTGQYYDSLSLDKKSEHHTSSVAATGMGLIALSLSDALGSEGEDAHDKVVQSLRFIIGQGKLRGQNYIAKRSANGWFRHWFDINTGADNTLSATDGYSTIDTAILVAGAQIAANYFSAKGKDPGGEIRRLADNILFTVNWESAIANMKKGEIFMTFDQSGTKPDGRARLFNEYALVACMGAYKEQRQKNQGPMSDFWEAHFAHPRESLPHKKFRDVELLTDSPKAYLSSFIIQFSTYLCGAVANNPEYREYMANAQVADQHWFSERYWEFEKKNNQPYEKKYLWGLGAGELNYKGKGFFNQVKYTSLYSANKIEDNRYLIVSPHIVAGFLPVYSAGIYDLLNMRKNGDCLYSYKGLDILWRCSLSDLTVQVPNLQAIDYSSMFLGLAAFNPQIGLRFFQRYSPGGGP